MEIKDFKDLTTLIKLCRKQGVTEFTCGDFSCKLGPVPVKASTQAEEQEEGVAQGEDDLDRLVGMPINPTDEQLMNWAHPMQEDETEETN